MRHGYFGARRVGGAEREHSDPKSQVKMRGHYYYMAELRNCVKVEVAILGFAYGFCGRKATLNQLYGLVTGTC